MEAAEYLKRPYGRLLLPDPDAGFAAEIVEFPGCIAIGKTQAEALSNLEEVAIEWISAALEQRQEIPEPFEDTEYSGRLGLRMARSIHKRAAIYAERDGVSLNQFIVNCVAEQIGMRARPHHQFVTTPTAAMAAVNISFARVIAPYETFESLSTGTRPPKAAKPNPWGQDAGS
jgi:antitoxin HicB